MPLFIFGTIPEGRLAIRAAEFGPEADVTINQWVENPRRQEFRNSSNLEGALREQ